MAGLTLSPSESDPRRISDVVRQLMEGRSNSVGTVTLRASQVTTTVSAPTCAPGSLVFLTPQTAHAAGVIASTYVLASNTTKGQFIISHPSDANVDKTFGWEVRG